MPVGLIFWRTFEHGFGPAWDAVTTPDARHAFWLTLKIAAIAVPLNTIFGIVCALAIVRHRFPGKGVLNAVVDLPLALSPVVVGLALFLLYGRDGWFGSAARSRCCSRRPAMVLATIFVSLPFVVREVVPVLREIGTDQEQAAATLGAGRVRDLPPRDAAGDPLGRRVRRRAARPRARIGEFGAVSVVSGRIGGKTETMTLLVQDSYESFDVDRRVRRVRRARDDRRSRRSC